MGTRIRQWLVLRKENAEGLTAAQRRLLDALKEFDGVAELAELEAALSKAQSGSRPPLPCRTAAFWKFGNALTMISVKYIRKAHLNCSAEEGYAPCRRAPRPAGPQSRPAWS